MSSTPQISKQSRTKPERRPNERLKAQRLKKNWTQVYVATMIGTSDVEISRWETGVSSPSLYFREKLCELFGTSPEDLGFVSSPKTEPEEHIARLSAHLPLPLTSLIGREQEMAAICALLRQAKVRLLTLTGTGGVGKTRLALEVAQEMQQDFTDGVCFVELAPIQDTALVLPAIAHVLHVQSIGTQPLLDHLKAALRGQHLLLVLDNFEHILPAAELLVELLAACPRLKLLVTSRAVLHVRGERIFPVQSLPLPDPLQLADREVVAPSGAVALFVERAREISLTCQFTPEQVPLIAEVCRRVDGLPLAIELAVARLKLFPLPVLLERLEHRLAVLTGGPRDLPERQQTLRNTLEWSYELLSEEEQRLFRLFCVFVGGCTVEAVEALSKMLDGSTPTPVLDGITSLLDKHLLYQMAQGSQELRLLILETIREYGLECLSASGELEQTRQAHAEYYLHLAEEAESSQFGPAQERWFARLEREYANLRAALRWAIQQGEAGQGMAMALRLARALVEFWTVRWYVNEERPWLERALRSSKGVPVLVRARALQDAAWLANLQDDGMQAEAQYQESLQLFREAGETQGVASSLVWLGWLTLTMRKDHVAAHSLLEESHRLAREVGDKRTLDYALFALGTLALDQADFTRARSLLEESLAVRQEMGYKQLIAWSLRALGRVLFAQGDHARAYVLVEESLALCREIHDKISSAYALDLLGRFAFARGDTGTARALLEEGLALFRALGWQRKTAYALCHVARVAAEQGDDAAARAMYEESLALFRQIDDTAGMAFCLQGWGALVARQGELVWATRLWGAAETLSAVSSPQRFSLPVEHAAYERTDFERIVSIVRTQLGADAFANAWAEGRTMTPEQALSAQGQPLVSNQPHLQGKSAVHKRRSLSSPHSLTERETEVLRLVAQGRSNAQIAEALVISGRTVEAHLRTIYSKLNVTSRYAAMHYALQHQLV
jgi:predicted ATPase/DNA-binding CsgD family transcriptional regulator/DNA-binding XRE family transcriptional regulator